MAESQKALEKKSSLGVGKLFNAMKDVRNDQIEAVNDKKESAKHHVSSLLSHGLSKAEKLVHSTKDYVDKQRTSKKIDGNDSDSSSSSSDDGDAVATQKSLEKKSSLGVGKIYDAMKEVSNDHKEAVNSKTEAAKQQASLLASNSLTQAEKYIHSAKDYLDKRRGTKIDGEASDPYTESPPLPASTGDAGGAAAAAIVIPGSSETQPLLVVHLRPKETSWCCGLFDCFTSSDK